MKTGSQVSMLYRASSRLSEWLRDIRRIMPTQCSFCCRNLKQLFNFESDRLLSCGGSHQADTGSQPRQCWMQHQTGCCHLTESPCVHGWLWTVFRCYWLICLTQRVLRLALKYRTGQHCRKKWYRPVPFFSFSFQIETGAVASVSLALPRVPDCLIIP